MRYVSATHSMMARMSLTASILSFCHTSSYLRCEVSTVIEAWSRKENYLSRAQREGYCTSIATSSSLAPWIGGHLVALDAISAAWIILGLLISSPNAFLWRSLRFTSTVLLSLRRIRFRKGSPSSSSESESLPKAGESRGVLDRALRFRSIRRSSDEEG